MSKIEKNLIFSGFCHILALKYQAYYENVLNIYSFYKNTTIMEQIEPNIASIYLKTTTILTIEAYLTIPKSKKTAIFEWLKI